MSTQRRLRRGTASETAVYTGASGEVTVDTTNHRFVVHDGVTPGGHPSASVEDIILADEKGEPNGVAELDASGKLLASQFHAGMGPIKVEALTIAVENTVPNLSEDYLPGLFLLIVNGMVFCPVGSPAPFSVSGNVVTWSSSIFTIAVGDSVVAIYTYEW